MLLRTSLFFALSISRALGADAASSHKPAAIYYSFDQPPADGLVSQVQRELNRMLRPAALAVEWHELGRDPAGEFPEIFTLRFHGSCTLERAGLQESARLKEDERSLAATQISDGHVLPFADIRCDLLRRFLDRASKGRSQDELTLGRAIARVAAHEIYHILTGSAGHRRSGVGQAEYSRKDLLSEAFQFAPDEVERLRQCTQLCPNPGSKGD